MKSEAIHLPHIGMRIIKSALGVLLCFVIYLIRGKQGTPFYSALAVLWCIQNQTRNTFGNALQRTIGTGIGALYGLVYILAKMGLPDVGDGILHYLLISVTLIPIIYSTVVIQQKKASYFSCVVFLSIVVNHLMDENPYVFVLNRTLDTLIGIFVGLVLNTVHIHGKLDRNKLFVMDLDRAMDGFSGGLTSYSQVSIKNMLEEGANITFMTMRTPAGFLEGMPDVKPKLPIIAMGGAILYDIKENRYPKVYVISSEQAGNIEQFIENRGFNVFTTVILEDVLIIYYNDLKNDAEKDIYRKMHKSPYRNYLNKTRPVEQAAVYMMCIDKTDRIEQLLKEIWNCKIYDELKIMSYPSDEYKGYSYIKIYNKNASVKNMIDYIKNQAGTSGVVTFSDSKRDSAAFHYPECNQIIRKVHHMFYWGRG
jgi:hypothetical protein